MKQGISPGQLIRLLQVMNPLMMALSECPKPESCRSKIVEDSYEGKTRYVVWLKAAYSNKEDAEKFLQLDEMIDKV